MIKYTGIFTIFFSSVMFGLYLVGRLSSRVNIIRSLIEMFRLFKREICYRMPTVSELFELCSELEISEFTTAVASKLSDGKSIEESVTDSVLSAKCLSEFTTEEKNALTEILSSLGTTDSEGQISIIDSATERFQEFLEKALEAKNKNSKIYMSVSVYVGLAAAILLI